MNFDPACSSSLAICALIAPCDLCTLAAARLKLLHSQTAMKLRRKSIEISIDNSNTSIKKICLTRGIFQWSFRCHRVGAIVADHQGRVRPFPEAGAEQVTTKPKGGSRDVNFNRVKQRRVSKPEGGLMKNRCIFVLVLAFNAISLVALSLSSAFAIGTSPEAKNMRLVGFNDLQARSAYQPIIYQQDGRWIAYVGHHGGEAFNPLTKVTEKNGTSIVDVTDPNRPRYLKHIPGPSGEGEAGGAQMVRACSAKDLPHADLNNDPKRTKHYLLRATATSHEVYDVSNPSNPILVTSIISNLDDTHKNFWECDTGIAYLVVDGQSLADGL